MTLAAWEIKALMEGDHEDVFGVLGPHVVETAGAVGVAVRALLPQASRVRVIPVLGDLAPRAMEPVHPAGLFEAIFPDVRRPFAYRLEVGDGQGAIAMVEDPYRFPSTLGEFDRHLLAEGTHYGVSDKLGAHLTVLDSVAGTVFAVWAPDARRVNVVGDFNAWDGRRHAMRRHPANGIWEIFVPAVEPGARYKFEIRSQSGAPIALKADPYAFAFEPEAPRTAAVVYRLEDHRWRGGEWPPGRGPAKPPGRAA